jgi:myosin-5
LNQGENPVIDGVNDAEGFEETTTALSLLGFSQREQADLFKILAAILHLGNVTIRDAVTEGDADGGDSEGSAIAVSSA